MKRLQYHVRDEIIVAVRDRHSGSFRPGHIGLNCKLDCGVKLYENGAMVPSIAEPQIGDAIFFTTVGPDGELKQIVTSRIEKIDRPEKCDLCFYPPEKKVRRAD